MAHYAFLDENNIVTQVIVGKNEDEKRDGVEVDWEEWYGNFHGVTCKRTSYNTVKNQQLIVTGKQYYFHQEMRNVPL